jgi:hypothetical protein
MHIYQTKHVRQCFSTLSDSQISAFQARGLVAFEALQKSIRKMFRYSALQIVHLGVLSQLSLWGILSRAEATNVSGMGSRWFGLKEAYKLVDLYYEAGPDVMLTVTLTEMPVQNEDQRLRTSRTEPLIRVIKSNDLGLWIKTYMTNPVDSKNARDFFDIDDAAPAEWFKTFGFLVIDVGHIIRHVYETLEITRFLK